MFLSFSLLAVDDRLHLTKNAVTSMHGSCQREAGNHARSGASEGAVSGVAQHQRVYIIISSAYYNIDPLL